MAETSKKNIESQQLEMFGDIGMAKSPAKKDPVSGNDIPKASTAEEVRDDIPARLSEGEFVLPADVVRYHGLEKLMNLRQEAKQGINTMDKMGQLGNADEATMPDDLPFDVNDIEMSEGGMVYVAGQPMQLPRIAGQQMQMQTGGFVSPTGTYQVPTQISTTPSYFQNYAQSTAPFTPFVPPKQTAIPPIAPITSPKTTGPTFQTLIPSEGQRPVTKEYRNAAGQKLFIPFVNDKPIYPIPEGYTEYVEEKAPIVEDKPAVTTPTTTVTGEGDSTDSTRVGTTTTIRTDFGNQTTEQIKENIGKMSSGQRGQTVMDALDKARGATGLAKGLQQFGAAITPGVLPAQMYGQKTFNPLDVLGKVGDPNSKDLNDILNAFGPDMSGLTPEEIDMTGIDRNEALSQAMYGMSYSDATKSFGIAPSFTKGYQPGQVDPTTNATYSVNGQATDDDNNVSYSSIGAFGNAMSASAKSGYYGGEKQAQKDAAKGNQKAKDFLGYLDIETLSDKESFTGSKDDTFGYDESQGTDPGDTPTDTSISDVGSEEDPGPSDTSVDDVGGDGDEGGPDSGEDAMGGEDVAKGSFITKRKASGKLKKKYMKRGGLASR